MRRPARMLPTLLLLLAGCAGSKPVDDLDLRLQAASHAFGDPYGYLVVHSAGPSSDRAYIAMSRTVGPQRLARDLAARLEPASREPVRMLLTGPNGDKNRQVLADALQLQGSRELPYLELLYLGEPAAAEAIRMVVEETGGRFRYAPYGD